MKKEVFDNGNIVLEKNKLHFYKDTLNYNVLESARYEVLPRRSLFKGIKEWIYSFFIMAIICNFWRKIVLIGDIYVLSGIPLILYNIYAFVVRKYILIIRTISGGEYSTTGRNLTTIQKITTAINERIEINSKTKNKNIIVNNGIINKGSGNINKMGGRK